MAKISKRQKALNPVDREKFYPIDEAIGLVKSNATAKFDETVEIALNLGVDPRHADQMVRGVVSLPKGTGKDVRVAVFAKGGKADEATAAGADVVGAEDLMERIQGGNIDFDRVIATPRRVPHREHRAVVGATRRCRCEPVESCGSRRDGRARTRRPSDRRPRHTGFEARDRRSRAPSRRSRRRLRRGRHRPRGLAVRSSRPEATHSGSPSWRRRRRPRAVTWSVPQRVTPPVRR